MENTYKKLNSFEIEVTREVIQPETNVTKYERAFIEQQIKTITEDKDRYNTLRDAEILECKNILAEMIKLNIVAKVEPIKEILPVEEIIK